MEVEGANRLPAARGWSEDFFAWAKQAAAFFEPTPEAIAEAAEAAEAAASEAPEDRAGRLGGRWGRNRWTKKAGGDPRKEPKLWTFGLAATFSPSHIRTWIDET